MEKINKNTEVNDTDKKLHISDVSCSFLHTTGGFEQSFKWLIENGYSEDVMKKILYNGGSLVVQIIDLGNEKITTNGWVYEKVCSDKLSNYQNC